MVKVKVNRVKLLFIGVRDFRYSAAASSVDRIPYQNSMIDKQACIDSSTEQSFSDLITKTISQNMKRSGRPWLEFPHTARIYTPLVWTEWFLSLRALEPRIVKPIVPIFGLAVTLEHTTIELVFFRAFRGHRNALTMGPHRGIRPVLPTYLY